MVGRHYLLLVLAASFVCCIAETPTYEGIFDQRGYLYNQAMKDSPYAREEEVLPLLQLLQVERGDVIIDAPSGGGYVAWSTVTFLDKQCTEGVNIIQIEPSEQFSSTGGHGKIHNVNTIHANLFDLPQSSESVNKVSSLAGLHHMTQEEKHGFFRESFRVLVPGGRFAVADVGIDTPQNQFLNDFVDRYTHTGHEGVFFAPNEFKTSLEQAGFRNVEEHLLKFKWKFNSLHYMLAFAHQLFGLEKIPSFQVILENLKQFGVHPVTNVLGAQFDWSLRYCIGIKPGDDSGSHIRGEHECSKSIERTIDVLSILNDKRSDENRFEKFRQLLIHSGWDVNNSAAQGYNDLNSDQRPLVHKFTPDNSYLPLGSGCNVEFLKKYRFPIDSANTENESIIRVVVFHAEENVIYMYNRKNEEQHLDVFGQTTRFTQYLTDNSLPNGNCFSLQEWTVSTNKNEFYVDNVKYFVTIQEFAKGDDVKEVSSSLVDLLLSDLNCSYHGNTFLSCSPVMEMGRWSLLR